jgi:glycerol-3-phosphate cytidylyltransferase
MIRDYQTENFLMIKGFTCGAFDLTHAGHYLMFEECKKNCDYLIVGLQIDPSVDRTYKHKPIQSLRERMIQLKACRWVDQVNVYGTEKDLVQLLKMVKPNVRFLGEDWKDKPFTGHELPIKIIFNSRDHNYSSTNLMRRICERK